MKLKKIFFGCGILAAILFIATDLLAGTFWRNYNFISQSISELSAVGSPTRQFVLISNLICDLLLIIFSYGIYREAEKYLTLKITAVFIFGNALLTAISTIFFPMRLGEIPTPNSVNVLIMMSAMFCFVLAILFGVVAFKNEFRFYSIGTLLAYAILTLLGIFVIPRINPAYPMVRTGIQERVMVMGYLLWLLILSIKFLRDPSKNQNPSDQ